jgi:ribosomal protein S12 methylthiotransferase accessory factor
VPRAAPPIVVYLGPSLPVDEARRRLPHAEFRPPIRREDLSAIAPGSVVGIIDGVFDQNLSVSPSEIRAAIHRGIAVLGSSSMGALRATEVAEMVGVGRVYQMFRDGTVERDEEVAVAFEPETQRAISEPLVNIRYAVDRLVAQDTISAALGRRLLEAAKGLFFAERSYERILHEAGVPRGNERTQLQQLLRNHDLKAEDAITLLETLPTVSPPPPLAEGSTAADETDIEPVRLVEEPPDDPTIFLWEYGDRMRFSDLVRFLKLTGRFAAYARNAVARFLLEGNELEATGGYVPPGREQAAHVFMKIRNRWELRTGEEVEVTLKDLGLTPADVAERVNEEIVAERRIMALAREGSPAFLEALRVELLLSDLDFKREIIRLGSLKQFAEHARRNGGTPSEEERRSAEDKICELVDVAVWRQAIAALDAWGVSEEECVDFADELALARRWGATLGAGPQPRRRKRSKKLRASPKVRGDRRFCVSLSRAYRESRRLCPVVGITRVAIITELSPIGLPNASAFRPTGTFSSTIGSGKSESELGAKVGAIMEEVEKWAQEQFPREGAVDAPIHGTLASVRRRIPAVDPRTLDLPHDSVYRPEMELAWLPLHDLVSGETVLVPQAAIDRHRLANDIYFSRRLGRKVMSTNGLASGFTLEEALTHAICEVIERHSIKLADVTIANPGVGRASRYAQIDLRTVPASTRRILDKIAGGGYEVRVLRATCEIGVPTYQCDLLIARETPGPLFGHRMARSMGFASHPDAEVALNMACLEAVQCRLTNIAGAREDLTIKARSLGRHERTRAMSGSGVRFFAGCDPPLVPFDAADGFTSRDAREDVEWVVARLASYGCDRVLFADLTLPEIRPARVVRVVVPGLDTTNPVHTGPRPRARMLADLLPR